jgi:hypothetical protein
LRALAVGIVGEGRIAIGCERIIVDAAETQGVMLRLGEVGEQVIGCIVMQWTSVGQETEGREQAKAMTDRVVTAA